MNKKISTGAGIAIVAAVGLAVAAFVWFGQEPQAQTQVQSAQVNSLKNQAGNQSRINNVSADWKTYTNAKYGYEIKYPKGWFLDNGRLSSQKIENYEIGSDNAPVHFGVCTQNEDVFDSTNKPDICNFDYYEYQIKNLKRNRPDSSLEINGLAFKRYDLIDDGRYEGDNAGNVILLVGPKMKNQDLLVVFEWQQFPGTQTLKSNQPQDFIDISSTFKFIK